MNARALVTADKMAVAQGVMQAKQVAAELKSLMENCTPAERAAYEVALAGNVRAIEDGKRYLRGMP